MLDSQNMYFMALESYKISLLKYICLKHVLTFKLITHIKGQRACVWSTRRYRDCVVPKRSSHAYIHIMILWSNLFIEISMALHSWMYGDNEHVNKMFPKCFQFKSRPLQRMSVLTQFIQGVMLFSTCCNFLFHKHNIKIPAHDIW
jgi:hypothetical protein